MKQKTTCFLLFFTLSTYIMAQTNLIVRQKSGTTAEHLIASIQKLTFNDNTLVVNCLDGTTQAYPIADVRSLIFGTTSDINSVSAETDFSVYPNPATDRLFITNATDAEVYIYQLDGRLAQHTKTIVEGIDISNLPAGFYLLKVNNHLAKFLKK